MRESLTAFSFTPLVRNSHSDFTHLPLAFSQVVEEVVSALDNKKAIHARLAALGWISRCVARSKPTIEVATLTTLAK